MIYFKDELRIVTRCGKYKIQVRETMVGAFSNQFNQYTWKDLGPILHSLEEARAAVEELTSAWVEVPNE